jgi:hypothetical protein
VASRTDYAALGADGRKCPSIQDAVKSAEQHLSLLMTEIKACSYPSDTDRYELPADRNQANIGLRFRIAMRHSGG